MQQQIFRTTVKDVFMYKIVNIRALLLSIATVLGQSSAEPPLIRTTCTLTNPTLPVFGPSKMPIANSTRKFSVAVHKQDELLSTQNTYFMKPEDMKLTTKEKIRRFFWDSKERSFFGRNIISWSKIILFYLIFYGMLAALVAICMWVFFQTLDPRIPKWQLDRSVIGTNPGLGFRPMPSSDNIDSSLIWFQASNKSNYLKWVDNLKGFLDKYYTPGKLEKGSATTTRCSYDQFPKEGEVCHVDVNAWGSCSREKFFDYHRNSPCIFLKLNKIYGWVPDYYNDPRDLPNDMPLQLKHHIGNITQANQRNTVWISCAGENTADIEYLGPIAYYPEIQGFPGYYYPYKNDEGYLSPLIAVQFLRPTSGVVINVECKAWAKNIKHNRQDRIGSVHFELLID